MEVLRSLAAWESWWFRPWCSRENGARLTNTDSGRSPCAVIEGPGALAHQGDKTSGDASKTDDSFLVAVM